MIEGIDVDIEGIVKPMSQQTDHKKLHQMVKDLLKMNIANDAEFKKMMNVMHKKYKMVPNQDQLIYSYKSLIKHEEIKEDKKFEELIQKKKSRGNMGVMVVAMFTSPYPEYINEDGKYIRQEFSCKYDCYFCPNAPGMPRSYLVGEPGLDRAIANNFDSVSQFWDRCNSYNRMGHVVDKIEVIVLGGTISSYPKLYLEDYFRDMFYAANTYPNHLSKETLRDKLSLKQEQELNHESKVHIIGITVETRPDNINLDWIRFFRRMGVTRFQLGVQTLDERVLYRINRQCTNKHTKDAIKLLKDCGFKIDIHLMADLPQPLKPGVDNKKRVFEKEDIDTSVNMVQVDLQTYKTVLLSEDYQVDQWKIYPTSTTNYTRIKDEFESGIYKPYGTQTLGKKEITPLIKLLTYVKSHVHPWIRLNRVIRDIPEHYILAGHKDANARTLLLNELKKSHLKCKCIRCREIKDKSIDFKLAKLFVRTYTASQGVEYFLSFETQDNNVIFGFLRLRLCGVHAGGMYKKRIVFPELIGSALIRELHVYSKVARVGTTDLNSVQHVGFGRLLIDEACKIAQRNGYRNIAVINGIGTVNYYKKSGFVYSSDKDFMHKTLTPSTNVHQKPIFDMRVNKGVVDPLQLPVNKKIIAIYSLIAFLIIYFSFA